MTAALADRFTEASIQLQPQEAKDLIKLPAVVFEPAHVEAIRSSLGWNLV